MGARTRIIILNRERAGSRPCAFDIPSWRSLRQGPSAVLAIIDAAMREHQAPLMGVIHSSVAYAPLTHLKNARCMRRTGVRARYVGDASSCTPIELIARQHARVVSPPGHTAA